MLLILEFKASLLTYSITWIFYWKNQNKTQKEENHLKSKLILFVSEKNVIKCRTLIMVFKMHLWINSCMRFIKRLQNISKKFNRKSMVLWIWGIISRSFREGIFKIVNPWNSYDELVRYFCWEICLRRHLTPLHWI